MVFLLLHKTICEVGHYDKYNQNLCSNLGAMYMLVEFVICVANYDIIQ